MVRAILDGRKTQTRRVVKNAPTEPEAEAVMVHGALCFGVRGNPGTGRETFHFTHGEEGEHNAFRCPYGVPGDLLWVREECWLYGRWLAEGGVTATGRPKRSFGLIGQQVRYENPGFHHVAYYGGAEGWGWRPSIHMPRWASRITLRVTKVRVERLQEISEADALAEGVLLEFYDDSRDAYADLWEHINGPGSWDANPWVWVVGFEYVNPAGTAATERLPAGQETPNSRESK
jgi:hypothetical protein